MKSLIDDSVITCDEVVDIPETVSIYVNDKKQHIKRIIIFFTFFY